MIPSPGFDAKGVQSFSRLGVWKKYLIEIAIERVDIENKEWRVFIGILDLIDLRGISRD